MFNRKFKKAAHTSVSVVEYSYSHSASFSGLVSKAGAVNGVAKGSCGGVYRGGARKGASNCAIRVCGLDGGIVVDTVCEASSTKSRRDNITRLMWSLICE
jgi:hypothetical protein